MNKCNEHHTFCFFLPYQPFSASNSLFLKNYFISFIFGCIGSSLLCAGFLQLWRVGATLRCGARASHCSGFSCCGAQALGTWASVVVARGLSSCGSQALECRLSSCGARAQLLRGTWDLPGPGLEPVSPALAGGFLTTAPPGKSTILFFERSHQVVQKPLLDFAHSAQPRRRYSATISVDKEKSQRG